MTTTGVREEVLLTLPETAGRPAGTLLLRRGAFGSGEHETTASCLEVLATLAPLEGMTMLDLGCGTGVLALAALRFGAAWAVCVDIDPRAARLAADNARINGLFGGVSSLAGEVTALAHIRFDLITANVPAEVFLGQAEALVQRTVSGGWLLLSGMLWEEAYDVRRRFLRLGCRRCRERWLDEYCTLLLQAPGAVELGGSRR